MPPFSNSRFHTQPSTVVSTKKMHWLLPFVKSTRKLQSRLRCKKRPWWCGWKRAGKSTLPQAVSTQLKPRMRTNAHEFWVSRPVGLGGPPATARRIPQRGHFWGHADGDMPAYTCQQHAMLSCHEAEQTNRSQPQVKQDCQFSTADPKVFPEWGRFS